MSYFRTWSCGPLRVAAYRCAVRSLSVEVTVYPWGFYTSVVLWRGALEAELSWAPLADLIRGVAL